MRRTFLHTVVISSLFAVSATPAFAQEATPATGDVPDPSECRVEPRPPDELIAIWFPDGTPVAATPADMSRSGTPVGTGFDVPVGEPADAETIDAVTATVRELLACFNGGDFLAAYSLYSDNLIRSFGPEPGTTIEQAEEFLAFESTPLPEEERLELIGITDVVVMEDGRVGAIVLSNDPTATEDGDEPVLVILVEENGRWLIDEIIEEDADTGGGEATPTT